MQRFFHVENPISYNQASSGVEFIKTFFSRNGLFGPKCFDIQILRDIEQFLGGALVRREQKSLLFLCPNSLI